MPAARHTNVETVRRGELDEPLDMRNHRRPRDERRLRKSFRGLVHGADIAELPEATVDETVPSCIRIDRVDRGALCAGVRLPADRES
jgi:hypothetical protein